MAECGFPTNKNFLSPIGFQFLVQRLPHVNYFCTSATLPDVSIARIDVENPFVKIPYSGDKLDFGALNLRFRIDEDMKNFQEIFDWLVGLGYPDSYEQRATLGTRQKPLLDVYSDASMVILTNQYKPNITINFIDIFPINLSSVEFNIEQSDVDYLQADVTFAYRKYDLIPVT